ncbi:MAG: nucleotidyltransferase family protein [Devosia sp.]|nr:nucleotidyltransferase family protein [Devosia sp.]
MRPSEIFEQNRSFVREVIGRYPVRNPRIFGSVLHRTDRDTSDIDILVDAPLGTTLLDLIGLEQELQKRLGVPVQVVTPGSLHRFFRDKVLSEAQPV